MRAGRAVFIFLIACRSPQRDTPPPPDQPRNRPAPDAAAAADVSPPPPDAAPAAPPADAAPVAQPPGEDMGAVLGGDTLMTKIRTENPKKVLYDEIVSANMATGFYYRVVIRTDYTWSVERPSGVADGKLDAAQRKTFDAALRRADIRSVFPQMTCGAVPSRTIEVRAKGKVAKYQDMCAAEPTPSLGKLAEVAHQLVGL